MSITHCYCCLRPAVARLRCGVLVFVCDVGIVGGAVINRGEGVVATVAAVVVAVEERSVISRL